MTEPILNKKDRVKAILADNPNMKPTQIYESMKNMGYKVTKSLIAVYCSQLKKVS